MLCARRTLWLFNSRREVGKMVEDRCFDTKLWELMMVVIYMTYEMDYFSYGLLLEMGF